MHQTWEGAMASPPGSKGLRWCHPTGQHPEAMPPPPKVQHCLGAPPHQNPSQFPYHLCSWPWGRAVTAPTPHCKPIAGLHCPPPSKHRNKHLGLGEDLVKPLSTPYPGRPTPLIHPCLVLCCLGYSTGDGIWSWCPEPIKKAGSFLYSLIPLFLDSMPKWCITWRRVM